MFTAGAVFIKLRDPALSVVWIWYTWLLPYSLRWWYLCAGQWKTCWIRRDKMHKCTVSQSRFLPGSPPRAFFFFASLGQNLLTWPHADRSVEDSLSTSDNHMHNKFRASITMEEGRDECWETISFLYVKKGGKVISLLDKVGRKPMGPYNIHMVKAWPHTLQHLTMGFQHF